MAEAGDHRSTESESDRVVLIEARERRRRIGARHALSRRTDLAGAVNSVVCLHCTEPANLYLSLWARTGCTREEIDTALYDDRTIVRQLAMRRTVFGFPRDLLPAVLGSSSARVASQVTARLAKEIEDAGLSADGAGWIRAQRDAVLGLLQESPQGTAALRAALPELDQRLEMAPGKSYGGSVPVAPRLLTVLAATGEVVRGRNLLGWRTSRPAWTLAEEWLGERVSPMTTDDGYRELVRRWLDRFGPGTEDDLVWWLGSTKAAVRKALAELDARQVRLDGATPGWVLPDDPGETADPGDWVALLPPLDPTTMGWKQRTFHLGDLRSDIFDRNGNAGATIWCNGQIVGTWAQDEGSVVHPILLTPDQPDWVIDRSAELAGELTEWASGEQFSSIYNSPAAREWLKAHR